MKEYEFVYFGETEDDFGDALMFECEIPDEIYKVIYDYKMANLDMDYYEDGLPDEDELMEDNVEISQIPGLESFTEELLGKIILAEKERMKEEDPGLAEPQIEKIIKETEYTIMA